MYYMCAQWPQKWANSHMVKIGYVTLEKFSLVLSCSVSLYLVTYVNDGWYITAFMSLLVFPKTFEFKFGIQPNLDSYSLNIYY